MRNTNTHQLWGSPWILILCARRLLWTVVSAPLAVALIWGGMLCLLPALMWVAALWIVGYTREPDYEPIATVVSTTERLWKACKRISH